jgi:hypothetical protein
MPIIREPLVVVSQGGAVVYPSDSRPLCKLRSASISSRTLLRRLAALFIEDQGRPK